MKKITSHQINGLNKELLISVLDEPGQGNACHHYQIDAVIDEAGSVMDFCTIKFQDGPIREFGVNGISNEALLAVVEHRLQGFQSGDYACRENAIALTKLQEVMMWLHKRTERRVQRGVEGTNTV